MWYSPLSFWLCNLHIKFQNSIYLMQENFFHKSKWFLGPANQSSVSYFTWSLRLEIFNGGRNPTSSGASQAHLLPGSAPYTFCVFVEINAVEHICFRGFYKNKIFLEFSLQTWKDGIASLLWVVSSEYWPPFLVIILLLFPVAGNNKYQSPKIGLLLNV